eukprot:TRINITY_DN27395_c0_g1_i1.p1 TRINITY_DN27395_c0_g1~~TRINITY_DN27395_c0_g1_i1.p1  ORF type:complete len:286 (+),score=35.39 TRINITY_DN27395_c0_g1_i1:447-1304(+)
MKNDFVVAGFESGGTTSLVGALTQTSEIYMMPFELSDWAHDFKTEKAPPPPCEKGNDGPPSYWPAFMSYAFWPAAETVERFNQQVSRCARNKLVGVWDSRYAAHELAVRKAQAMLSGKSNAKVLLGFRDPIRYVVSTFNRIKPDAPGGSSLENVVAGLDRDPDSFGLHLWKGNYSLLTRRFVTAIGRENIFLQPFDTLVRDPHEGLTRILGFLGSNHQVPPGTSLPHNNRGPRDNLRIDPCKEEAVLKQLAALYRGEYARLRRLLHGFDQEIPHSVERGQPEWNC